MEVKTVKWKGAILATIIVVMFIVTSLVASTVPIDSVNAEEVAESTQVVIVDENKNTLYDKGDSWFFDKNGDNKKGEKEVGGDFGDTFGGDLSIINTTCTAFQEAINNRFTKVTTNKPVFIDHNGDGNLQNIEFRNYDLASVKSKASVGDTIVIPEKTVITFETQNGPVHLQVENKVSQTLTRTILVGYCEADIDVVSIGKSISGDASTEYTSTGKQSVMWFPGFWGQWKVWYSIIADQPGYDYGYHLYGKLRAQGYRLSETGSSYWFGSSNNYDLYGTDYIHQEGEDTTKFPTPTFQFLNLYSRAQGTYEVWDGHSYDIVDSVDVDDEP